MHIKAQSQFSVYRLVLETFDNQYVLQGLNKQFTLQVFQSKISKYDWKIV